MNSLRQSLGVLARTRSTLSTAAFSSSSTLRRAPPLFAPATQHNCSSLLTLTFQKSTLNPPPSVQTIVTGQGQRLFSSDTSASPEVKERFDKLVKNNKVVVFMKGVPDEPRCGFSNAVVQILRMHGVAKYDSHDVLSDESIRQGIKDYTSWPTIPQVFINGEFIGGCDILIEMHKNGELVEQLSKVGIKSALVKEGDENNK